MRKKLLRGVAVTAAVLMAAAVYVVVDSPGGIAGLVGPVAPDMRVDQVLAGIKAETPFVATLEARRPDVYGTLRDALIAEAAAGTAVQRLAHSGRRFVADWLADAIATAPDDIALEMLAVTAAALAELAQSDPAACAAFADGGVESAAPLSVTLRDRMEGIYMRLAAVPAGHTAVTLPQAEINAANAAIAPALDARFGADMADTDPDAARACAIQIAMLEAYAGLGAAQAAALARSMLGGAAGVEAPQPGS